MQRSVQRGYSADIMSAVRVVTEDTISSIITNTSSALLSTADSPSDSLSSLEIVTLYQPAPPSESEPISQALQSSASETIHDISVQDGLLK